MNSGEFSISDAIDVIVEMLDGGGEFRMFPKGVSMLPLIVQGRDSVVLKKKPASEVKKNDIAFYRRDNGQFVLHRIMKICADGTYVMCGDNQTTLETGIRQDQIIGHVCSIYKGDKLLSMSSFKYRAYVFFWCFMPYRRVERFFKRILSFIKRKIFKIK